MALQGSPARTDDDDYDFLYDCCCSLIPGIHAAGACAQIAEPQPPVTKAA